MTPELSQLLIECKLDPSLFNSTEPFIGENNQYHYNYIIKNKINGKIYYGKHSTDRLDDDYMGSGICIENALKKYGIENFSKNIVYFFKTSDAAFDMEREIVNVEFLKRKDIYNIKVGGKGNWMSAKMTTVKDINGNIFRVKCNDNRFKSGEIFGVCKGKILYKDKDGNFYQLEKDDPKIKQLNLYPFSKDMVTVKDKDGNIKRVSKFDKDYLNGSLISINKNTKMITNGIINKKYSQINGDDFKLQNGWWFGQTKPIKNINKEVKEVKHKKFVWIIKDGNHSRILSDLLEFYLEDGWKIGRKSDNERNPVKIIKFGNIIIVDFKNLQKYLNDGWKISKRKI
jgi:hypothetical protein